MHHGSKNHHPANPSAQKMYSLRPRQIPTRPKFKSLILNYFSVSFGEDNPTKNNKNNNRHNIIVKPIHNMYMHAPLRI